MNTRPVAAIAVAALLTAGPAPADPMSPATRPTTRPAPAIDATAPSADGAVLTFPDAVSLDNGAVRLAYSPGAGRVVEFGRSGGPNLLWISPPDPAPMRGADRLDPGDPRVYHNLGGEKLWATVQSMWGRAYGSDNWPPDGVIDGSAWTVVEQNDRRIVCESGESPHLGIVARRTYELDADQPVVRVTNELRRVRPNVFPVFPWTVAQVRVPEFALLGTTDSPPAAWTDDPKSPPATEPADGALVWTIPADTAGLGQKTATTGGWVAGVFADDVFLQSTDVDPDGSYPDGSNAQVYLGETYLELELLAPSTHPDVGESASNEITWRLVPRDGRSVAELLPVLERAVAQDRAE